MGEFLGGKTVDTEIYEIQLLLLHDHGADIAGVRLIVELWLIFCA
jgi:hypothetical protein